MGWIDIKAQSLWPPDGKKVEVFIARGGYFYIAIYDSEFGWSEMQEQIPLDGVTHWRVLIPPSGYTASKIYYSKDLKTFT